MYELDDDALRVINKVIRDLHYKFAYAHYPVDIEFFVWQAVYCVVTDILFVGDIDYALLRTIATNYIIRDLTKVRNIYVRDIASNANVRNVDDDDIKLSDLSMDSLTEEERQYIQWYVYDELTLRDISDLNGVPYITVRRRWKRIINKLHKENCDNE